MTTEIEAMNVAVNSLPDTEDGTYTKNGGYEVTIIDTDQNATELEACALNLNGFAFSVSEGMSIGEHDQTIVVTQETEGGYLNLEVQKQ